MQSRAGVLSLKAEEFLRLRDEGTVVFDVRSPAEYQEGHIPGAISLPIFSDEERAQVGTIYVKQGREKAFLHASHLVGKKIPALAEKLIEAGGERPVLIYCWRGGMRSESVARLGRWAGIETFTLEGGYKAYRRYLLWWLATTPYTPVVIAGFTGSNKTQTLKTMSHLGEQTLDLEDLANHRGSVFGHLGMPPQPTTQQFQNNIFERMCLMNIGLPIWTEDESMRVGEVFLPEPLYQRLRDAPALFIEKPFEERLENIIAKYGQFSRDQLLASLQKLQKHLNPGTLATVHKLICEGNLKDAAVILLRYYDTRYQQGILRRKKLLRIDATGLSPLQTAQLLKQHLPWALQHNKPLPVSHS